MNNSSKESSEEEIWGSLYYPIPAEIFSFPDLSDKAKLLYGLLHGYCRENGKCWPSDQHLAKKLNIATKTVQAPLMELEKLGLISREMVPTENPFIRRRIIEIHRNVKLSLRIPEIGESGILEIGEPESPKSGNRYNKDIYINKRDKDATPPASLNDFSSDKCKKKFEPEDLEMAKYLSEKVKAHNNKELFNLPKWATDFNVMRRLHGYTQENMKKVIDIAHEHDMWRTVILSPKKLRQHFTAIMALVPKKKDRIKENKNLAEKECHKNNNLEATENYLTVRNWSGQSTAPVLPYQDEEFEDKLRKFTERYKKP